MGGAPAPTVYSVDAEPSSRIPDRGVELATERVRQAQAVVIAGTAALATSYLPPSVVRPDDCNCEDTAIACDAKPWYPESLFDCASNCATDWPCALAEQPPSSRPNESCRHAMRERNVEAESASRS